MTPMIKEFVRLADDPEKMMWFDIGQAPDTDMREQLRQIAAIAQGEHA